MLSTRKRLLTRLHRSCTNLVSNALHQKERLTRLHRSCTNLVLCSLVNICFWWRALLTDWCGPVQSCQPLFLVVSIAYRLVRSYAVLSTSLSGGEHCLQIGAVLCSLVNLSYWWRALLTDWCGPVLLSTSLSGGEHCLPIGAVLCSLVNISFWWRALLTDWCGPVQSCQHLFLVESITYRLVRSCAVLSTSLSGGEHYLPIGAFLCSLVNLSFWWRAFLTDWCGPVLCLVTGCPVALRFVFGAATSFSAFLLIGQRLTAN